MSKRNLCKKITTKRLLNFAGFFAHVDTVSNVVAIPFKSHTSRDAIVGIGEATASTISMILIMIAMICKIASNKNKTNTRWLWLGLLVASNVLATIGAGLILGHSDSQNSAHKTGIGLVAVSKLFFPLVAGILPKEKPSKEEDSDEDETTHLVLE